MHVFGSRSRPQDLTVLDMHTQKEEEKKKKKKGHNAMCLWFQITGNRIYVRHKYLDNIHTKHLWVQETMESVLNVNTRQHSCKMSLGPRNHGICARDEYWTTCTHAKCLWVQETTGSVLDTKTGKPYLIQWLQNRGPSKEHVAKVTVQMLCTSINRTSDKHTHCIYTY